MQRRAVLVFAAGGLFGAAGCLDAGVEGSPGPTESDLVTAGSGDYPHDITVYNASGREVRVTITVDRQGREIYRETHSVDAETSQVVGGITQSTLPEGDRRLVLTARLPDGQSSQVDVDVTDCLGSVDFTIDASGELRSTYSIC